MRLARKGELGSTAPMAWGSRKNSRVKCQAWDTGPEDLDMDFLHRIKGNARICAEPI